MRITSLGNNKLAIEFGADRILLTHGGPGSAAIESTISCWHRAIARCPVPHGRSTQMKSMQHPAKADYASGVVDGFEALLLALYASDPDYLLTRPFREAMESAIDAIGSHI